VVIKLIEINLVHETKSCLHLFIVLNFTKQYTIRIRPVYAPANTRRKDILGSWCIACCKLTPTFARQMWRHNYVIGRNEYLISTLSAIAVP